ncbi:MAG: hypothetical protein EBV19_08890 [Flavobacteriia bacterium]|nr:hypothetical protein [Flavobacteriia bacterium]
MRWFIILTLIFKVYAFYRERNTIYKDDGTPIKLHGINWFGFETPTFTVEGLASYGIKEHIVNISAQGFNAIRLPLCLEGVISRYEKKPDIEYILACHECQNATTWEILHMIMNEALVHGIYILIDMHRLLSIRSDPLWYVPSSSIYNEQKLIDGWDIIIREFYNYSNLIGVDIYNEPHGVATFNSGDISTDWMLFTRRWFNHFISKAINREESLLIFVEGVHWGQDMKGFGPLLENDKWCSVYFLPFIILSPHAYGPTLTHHIDANESITMSRLENYFGYMNDTQTIVIGEWGGRSDSVHDKTWGKHPTHGKSNW